MTQRLLTARELADRFGVHAETVLRWHRRGQLPGVHLPGGAVRFQEEAVERWLASRASGVDSDGPVGLG